MGRYLVRTWSGWLGALGVVLLGLGLAGCDSGGGSSSTEPEPARIVVVVVTDGAAESGVTVRLFEAGSATARLTRQTDASGEAEFGGLEPGSYEVEIEVPSDLMLAAGQSARRSVMASAGSTAVVEISLVPSGIVEIRLTSGFEFDRSSVTISPGTTVRWVNDADVFHTITPDGHTEWQRVEMFDEGDVFTHDFDTAGVFDYFCEPHESLGMTGTIIVE